MLNWQLTVDLSVVGWRRTVSGRVHSLEISMDRDLQRVSIHMGRQLSCMFASMSRSHFLC